MSQQWYYTQDGAQYGPVDEAEIIQLIQDGELAPGTPVLKVGSMDWEPARNHACFQVEIYPKKKRPSVQAGVVTTSKPASGGTSQSPRQTAAQPAATSSPVVTTVVVKEKSVLPWVVAGVAGVAALIIAVMLFFGDGDETETDFANAPQNTGAGGSPPVQPVVPVSPPVPPAKKPALPTPVVVPVTPPVPTGDIVNSLGMKFVPVPGTGVAFCIWETRVKDYAAYASANSGVDTEWKSPGFTQADTHPVVKVSWKDAQAFCEWLTKKEMAEGKIKVGQKYRLPTDAEWSVAVGLGKEKGNTPEEKSRGIKDVYPWGNTWPPPKGAGNYYESLNVDSYDYTAPVGSFAANKLGLHDMGGNVSEWCEDKWNATSGSRVLRGASWYDNYRVSLLSSLRYYGGAPDYRGSSIGFRCVLVDGSGG
jgi:hypothetical protein